MIGWDRLRVFAAVAERGSIAAAAEQLHITGPAVSQHLRKLEREARCQLVEPDGRGIRLTAAGRVLAGSARAMADTASVAERDLATIDEVVAGPLRIGAVASAVRALLPGVLRALAAAHPRLEPRLCDGEVNGLLPTLQAGQLDAVIMESWDVRPAPLPSGVLATRLLTEDVVLAVDERHPLAGEAAVSVDQLHRQSWTSCPAGTEAHVAVVQILRQHGVHVDIRYQVADYSTQLSLVAAGLAVAMIPRTGRPATMPGVRFLPCDPPVTRTLSLATPSSPATPPIRALTTELQRATTQLI
jgi:DNA-binding transcriptional LysR family regulator